MARKSKPKPARRPAPKLSARQQFLQDIGDIGTPMSGQTMVNVAGQLVNREYDPLFGEIRRSEGDVARRRDQQQQHAKGYYADLAKLFGSTVGGQQAANQQAVTGAQQARDQQLAAIDAAAEEAQQRAAHDAEVRGAGLDGGSLEQLAAQRAQAKMRAQAQGATQENSARNFGAVQEAFLRGMGGATAQRGGETQGAIARRGDELLGELSSKRASLMKEREGKLTDTLLNIRKGEVEHLLTEKGISSDLAQAQLDADVAATKIRSQADLAKAKMRLQARLEQMGIDADKAKQMADQQFQAQQKDLDRQNNITVAGMRSQGAEGFSRKDKVKSAGKRDDAILLATQLKNGTGGMRANRNEALTILTDKYGSDFARAAVGAIYDGGAKPHLVKLLQDRYGIGIPRQYLR